MKVVTKEFGVDSVKVLANNYETSYLTDTSIKTAIGVIVTFLVFIMIGTLFEPSAREKVVKKENEERIRQARIEEARRYEPVSKSERDRLNRKIDYMIRRAAGDRW